MLHSTSYLLKVIWTLFLLKLGECQVIFWITLELKTICLPYVLQNNTAQITSCILYKIKETEKCVIAKL